MLVAGVDPPNWKLGGADCVVPDEPPKLNCGADWALSPLPEEKGLLKELPEEALLVKLNPALPEPPLAAGVPDPNDRPGALGAAVALGVLDEPPKMLDDEFCVPPKLKTGAAVPLAFEALKGFLAGDASSCFMGLPANIEFDDVVGGDFGAPNSGLLASEGVPFGLSAPDEAPPKLKVGTGFDDEASAAGAGVAPSPAGLAAPNRLEEDEVDAFPNRLPAGVAGLEPNNDEAVAGVALPSLLPPPKLKPELGAEDVAAAGVSALLLPKRVELSDGLAPKSVEACVGAAVDGSAGLLAAPKMLLAGLGCSLPPALVAAPKMLLVALDCSGFVELSVEAGWAWNSEPALGCGAVELEPKIDGFVA